MSQPSPRISLSAPDLGEAERRLLLETYDAGWVSSVGPMVERFEREFAASVGLAHATALSSGTAALHLALSMLDLKPGDAVIAPSLTFTGSAAISTLSALWPMPTEYRSSSTRLRLSGRPWAVDRRDKAPWQPPIHSMATRSSRPGAGECWLPMTAS